MGSSRIRIITLSGVLAAGCGGGGGSNGDDSANTAVETTPTTTPDPSSTAAATTATSATTAGDTSSGSSSTGPDWEVPEIDCGEVTFHEDLGLRRFPYLQSISDSSARVAWTSINDGAGTVRVAPSPDGPWTEVMAASTAFPVTYTNDAVDYWAHDATLPGLEPNSAYCYEVLEDGETLASGLSFQTAWEGAERGVRILAFGDSGDFSPEQLGLRDQMMDRGFDVFLHLGDMAYGDGTFPEFEERVFLVYRDLLHRVPTYPAPGNHEYKTPNAQTYIDVYYLWEQALREEDQERYYSFDYGEAHFVSLDTNTETMVRAIADEDGTGMFDWLEQDLAASTKPWKIAFFHHPPYSSSERDDNLLLRNTVLPILEAGGVDLVLAGHDHHYERSTAIKNGEPTLHQDGGIYYFVVGSGGAGLRAAEGEWWAEAVEDQNHAFLDLTIDGCRATGQAIGIRGQIVDQFELTGCDE